ncbi:MAG: recombinase RecA [Candidatus Wallbacteria bacterium HGW-Wallbacteria-1]|uniref:Protein RecA n=1 Tax=Candidatus Wallbacteria bacterium HGW-Wallbacteria-1 TaxID=2013854 RepID=A0A2N1PTR4_9BACT|nr:MAG: recombinase RecA [Candidatus Wallbacteria bacterium HGW-Wallbacteria-1]
MSEKVSKSAAIAAEQAKEKEKIVDVAVNQIRKLYGKGAIMRLGESHGLMDVESISTGIMTLDRALGIGGLPRGRIIEVYGPESSGKTSLSLQVIAQAQKQKGLCAFIDVEHALDPAYAKTIGVDVDQLLVSQPSAGEEALEIADILIRSNSLDVIVVDSVAALIPKAEIEGNIGDTVVGLQARLMSQAMRKLTAVVAKSRTILIFINQIREKIGVMFGNPETTPGGRALKFYSSVRLDVRRKDTIKKDAEAIGTRVNVKVVKNKVAPPFRSAEIDLMFAQGFNALMSLVDVATEFGIVEKSGAWFSYGEERIGQGRERVCAFLEERPEIVEKINEAVIQRLGWGVKDNAAEKSEIIED